MTVIMTRIPVPDWADKHSRHVIDYDGDCGELVQPLAAPLLPQIYAELDRRVNECVNDPGRCFLHESEGFPLRDTLDGRYYIGDETYQGFADEDDGHYSVTIMVRCLGKPRPIDHERNKYDYLGLEFLVYIDRRGTTFEFDEGLNKSCIG